MTKSSVVDSQTGKSMDSTVRTSTGTFFARGQDEVLEAIERRIAQVTYRNLHMILSCIYFITARAAVVAGDKVQ